MDFVQIKLNDSVDTQSVTIEFNNPSTIADFDVQLWKLKSGLVTPLQRIPDHEVEPEILSANPDGDLVYFIPKIDVNEFNKLGLIITRMDADERLDSAGVYTITSNSKDGDSDGDGMHNIIECPELPCRDSDGDTIPDFLDLDSDHDTIPDQYEAQCTANNDYDDDAFPCNSDHNAPDSENRDNVPDYLDLDSDGDGVSDLGEAGPDRRPITPDNPTQDPVEGDVINNLPAFRDPLEVYIPPQPSAEGVEGCGPFYKWPNGSLLPWGFDRGVVCGMQMIRDTLATAGITVTVEDPPVPGMLFSTTPFHTLPPGSAQSVPAATATHTSTSIAASFTTSHTVLAGNLSATWTTDAWAGAQFTSLSVPWAQVYDENNTLIVTGTVQAIASPPWGGREEGPSRWPWATPSPTPSRALAPLPFTLPPPTAWAWAATGSPTPPGSSPLPPTASACKGPSSL